MFALDVRTGSWLVSVRRCTDHHPEPSGTTFDEEDLLGLFQRAREGEDPVVLMAEMMASVGEG